jgi:predicted nucleotidyltransferase
MPYGTVSGVIPILGTSRTRRRPLEEFYAHPKLEAHVREIARRTGVAPGLAQRELAQLQVWGVLRSEVIGRSRRYRLDDRSPIAAELRSLFQKTAGVEGTLKDALAGVAGVEAAAIFGSYANQQERPGRDIDLLVIGQPARDELSIVLDSVERSIGREVNVVTMTRAKLTDEIERGSAFIKSLRAGRLIGLAGEVFPGNRRRQGCS